MARQAQGTRRRPALQAEQINPPFDRCCGISTAPRPEDKTGFLLDDPLYQRVRDAYDKVHACPIDLHYLSCDSGVGKPKGPSDRSAPILQGRLALNVHPVGIA